MSRMTDEEVVKTLAVFDGIVSPDELYRIHQCGTSLSPEVRARVLMWYLAARNGHDTDTFLEYLCCYDSIASIQRKLSISQISDYVAELTGRGGEWTTKDWQDFITESPKKHAHALAKVIKEST